MSLFNLKAPFSPTGDQPTAIDQLTKNLKNGAKDQVLLGVTGSGKSVAWDEPVIIKKGEKLENTTIGACIDAFIGPYQSRETIESTAPANWQILAWNPNTGETNWQKITGLSRHTAPEKMYRLVTSCGREVTVTGDHSVWIMREGMLHLVHGDEVTPEDALPIPRTIPGPEVPLLHLNLLDLIENSPGEISTHIPLSTWENPRAIHHLERTYTQSASKLTRIKHYQEGIRPELTHVLVRENLIRTNEIFLSGKARLQQSAELQITPELCTVLGQYIAEGHSTDKFSLISTREEETQQHLEFALRKSSIPFFRRKDGDFVIGHRIWRNLFAVVAGTHAHKKTLPQFWPQLSNAHLGALLRAYFEGDGGVESSSVTAVTCSKDLATSLNEALLRFGIWARLSTVRKKKPDQSYGTYYKISITGSENLTRYSHSISFLSKRKQNRLLQEIKKPNTNTDLIHGAGKILKHYREQSLFTKAEIARRANCSRAAIILIERGERSPSRTLFLKLCSALEIKDVQILGLTNLFWSKVASCVEEKTRYPFVYDFSVAGYETFFTGRGGLFVHNTYTMANVIQNLDRPTLVMAHNKTLAAQLFSEFREFFPDNSVQYFVSYYDYYQPEAYIPRSDTFIEKESDINQEIEKFRHASTHALLTRRDVIIVASVSCIYGLGSPEVYRQANMTLKQGEKIDRTQLARRLSDIQYERNDVELRRGRFMIKGDVVTIFPAYDDFMIRITQFGDEIEKIERLEPITFNKLDQMAEIEIFPAKHYLTQDYARAGIIAQMEQDLNEEVNAFNRAGKLVEAQRLKQRTTYDIDMIRETGSVSGIENYSRYFDQRAPGTAPSVLLDYFPKDYLLMIDESHMTIPQIGGMYNGDQARKGTLIDYGFRLKAARDNRPLTFAEFSERMGQTIYVSATPAQFELNKAKAGEQEARIETGEKISYVAEQLIRPTGIVDPKIEVRPVGGQIDNLLGEIKIRLEKGQRTLVTTLTKRMAEDVSEFLLDQGIKVNYLHSDIQTMERSQILQDLRLGVYDVLVGINLLREGLDLPEVSLVAILDADKEGFLRSSTALVQTIGRAARHPDGTVIMYADRVTGSMQFALDETERRRTKQVAYNTEHNIVPEFMVKPIVIALPKAEVETVEEEKAAYIHMNAKEKAYHLEELREKMQQAVLQLDFEVAAELRDRMKVLQEK